MSSRTRAQRLALAAAVSRSAPGTVDLGSLEATSKRRQQSAARSQSATLVTAQVSAPPSLELGIFCHYCGSFAGLGTYHTCIECSAIICEQARLGASGCISFQTVTRSTPFVCPLCSRKKEYKATPLPYVHHGFITRRTAKLCWPMCLINLKLESLHDNYASSVMKLELENNYKGFEENVSVLVGVGVCGNCDAIRITDCCANT